MMNYELSATVSNSSFIVLFNLCSKGLELFYYQIVVETQSRQVIEHSLRIASVSGATVRANAFFNRSIYQRSFADFFKHCVERLIYRLPLDLLTGQLARQPRPDRKSV